MIHRKKKLLGKKSDDEYPLTNEDEIFNGRYRVQGKQMGLVPLAWGYETHPFSPLFFVGIIWASCWRNWSRNEWKGSNQNHQKEAKFSGPSTNRNIGSWGIASTSSSRTENDRYVAQVYGPVVVSNWLSLIVHLKCSFLHKGFQCLVFELLSYNLYELIQSTGFRGIGLSLLRKVAGQILQVGLYVLHIATFHWMIACSAGIGLHGATQR